MAHEGHSRMFLQNRYDLWRELNQIRPAGVSGPAWVLWGKLNHQSGPRGSAGRRGRHGAPGEVPAVGIAGAMIVALGPPQDGQRDLCQLQEVQIGAQITG